MAALINRKIRRQTREGTATVELAVTVPVLVLIVFGLIEVGQGVLAKQVLVNAARDGARSATLEGATVADVETTVLNFLASSGMEGATVTVSPSPLTVAQGGDPVSVTVSVPFSAISWLPAPFYLGGASLEATVVMRREVFIYSEETEGS